jgi:hypothetical protein
MGRAELISRAERVDKARLGEAALKTLAVIRLVNGTLGLLAPGFLAKRTGTPPGDTAPYYAFRMFGVRTVVLGADLLLLKGEAGRRARVEAVLIHGIDTASATVGAIRGDLPARTARRTVAISAINTLLAVLTLRYARDD